MIFWLMEGTVEQREDFGGCKRAVGSAHVQDDGMSVLPLLGWAGAAFGAVPQGAPATRPESGPAAPLGRRAVLHPERRPKIDDVLTGPYDDTVPFGSSGDRLWATSPPGFGFGDGVNVVYVNDFVPFDLRIDGLAPRHVHHKPSHVKIDGVPGRRLTARASFTFAIDGAQRPLAEPFTPEKRWTCWNSKSREDWYEVDAGEAVPVQGAALHFFDDEATGGGCRPPEWVRIEAWRDGHWHAVKLRATPVEPPRPGENRYEFEPVETRRLRFTFRNRGEAFYTGLYGVALDIRSDAPAAPLPAVSVAKFLTQDDRAVAAIEAENPTDRLCALVLRVATPWLDAASFPAKPLTISRQRWSLSGAFDLEGARWLGRLTIALDGGSSPGNKPQATVARDMDAAGSALVIRIPLEPKARRQASIAFALDGPASAGSPDPDDSFVKVDPVEDPADALQSQIDRTQAWFDWNVATFECSDPAVTKLYWHRAYLLKKNFMNPRWGHLTHRCCAEGRWRADWYANVISYGAAHQIREARWLADPSYAWGQLATWAENPKPDGIFPNHVKPDGAQKGQYTDWISSTALDVMAVHPDAEALRRHFAPLARNARAWIDVFDRDGDFLPVVDSHWWTGMEWQPSFFAFSGFSPDEGGPNEADLERVDLAAYAFGNAKNMAACARLLGDEREARSLDELASRIQNAVETKLWHRDWKFFLSNRWKDDAPALVKEVIGVYPFYFGLPAPGRGFEAAWSSILDPEEFWGPWPVRSCSKRCPAYNPGRGWSAIRDVQSGCMWNGPAWPHANSIVMTAMARTLRDYPPCNLTKEHLFELFNSFTRAQFVGEGLGRPWTGEYYHADTGRWMTGERDYNHSTYLDVLVPELCGLRPRVDSVLEVDPLLPRPERGGWTHFLLDGVRYRGHDVTIVWDAPDGVKHYEGVAEGLTLFVDGVRRAHREDLGRLTVPLDGR